MQTCPGCERRVERLYFVPPGVVTRELFESFERAETPTDLEMCGDCVNRLVGGGAIA